MKRGVALAVMLSACLVSGIARAEDTLVTKKETLKGEVLSFNGAFADMMVDGRKSSYPFGVSEEITFEAPARLALVVAAKKDQAMIATVTAYRRGELKTINEKGEPRSIDMSSVKHVEFGPTAQSERIIKLPKSESQSKGGWLMPSIESVMSYYGRPCNYSELKAALDPQDKGPIAERNIEAFFRKSRFSIVDPIYMPMAKDTEIIRYRFLLLQQLKNGHPVLALIYYSDEEKAKRDSRYALIVGYDLSEGVFICQRGDIRERFEIATFTDRIHIYEKYKTALFFSCLDDLAQSDATTATKEKHSEPETADTSELDGKKTDSSVDVKTEKRAAAAPIAKASGDISAFGASSQQSATGQKSSAVSTAESLSATATKSAASAATSAETAGKSGRQVESEAESASTVGKPAELKSTVALLKNARVKVDGTAASSDIVAALRKATGLSVALGGSVQLRLQMVNEYGAILPPKPYDGSAWDLLGMLTASSRLADGGEDFFALSEKEQAGYKAPPPSTWSIRYQAYRADKDGRSLGALMLTEKAPAK